MPIMSLFNTAIAKSCKASYLDSRWLVQKSHKQEPAFLQWMCEQNPYEDNSLLRRDSIVWQIGTKVLEEHAPTTFRVEVTLVLKMQAQGSSKMLTSIYQTKRRHISRDHNLSIHCHENLTSEKLHTVVTQWLTKLLLVERNTFKLQHRHQLQRAHDPVHWNVDDNISNLDISCAATLYSFWCTVTCSFHLFQLRLCNRSQWLPRLVCHSIHAIAQAGSQLPASDCGGLCSIQGQSIWGLWWT
jgi:hypothetical protein